MAAAEQKIDRREIAELIALNQGRLGLSSYEAAPLLYLCAFLPKKAPAVTPPMTKRTMASMLNVAERTVQRQLASLRDRGLLKVETVQLPKFDAEVDELPDIGNRYDFSPLIEIVGRRFCDLEAGAQFYFLELDGLHQKANSKSYRDRDGNLYHVEPRGLKARVIRLPPKVSKMRPRDS